MVIGAPVVYPSLTPVRISGISPSFLGVVPFLPLFLRARSDVKSSVFRGIPGDHPSTVTPIAGPCDSPKRETLKTIPKVFIT